MRCVQVGALRLRESARSPRADADGTLASCTIAWTDPVSRIGSFEPFGTRPEFRGSGVSRAVLCEGLKRLASRGMTSARIYTACFNQPALTLYRSCGFAETDRNLTFLKRL
ncbi:MAG: GNAT family N-acetyltransferase [Pseudomonadales bacterium]